LYWGRERKVLKKKRDEKKKCSKRVGPPPPSQGGRQKTQVGKGTSALTRGPGPASRKLSSFVRKKNRGGLGSIWGGGTGSPAPSYLKEGCEIRKNQGDQTRVWHHENGQPIVVWEKKQVKTGEGSEKPAIQVGVGPGEVCATTRSSTKKKVSESGTKKKKAFRQLEEKWLHRGEDPPKPCKTAQRRGELKAGQRRPDVGGGVRKNSSARTLLVNENQERETWCRGFLLKKHRVGSAALS